MVTMALAIVGCACGFFTWYPRAGRPRRRMFGVLAIHLYFVAAGTANLELFSPSLGPRAFEFAMGGWFALLAVVHAGHFLSVRYLGAPLNRSTAAYALRQLPSMAKISPFVAAAGVATTTVAFFIGAILAHADLYCSSPPVAERTGLPPTAIRVVSLLGVLAIYSLRRRRIWKEPVLRLLGGADLSDYGLAPGDLRQQEIEL